MAIDEKTYQFAKLLIKLRNALVHFKPEWHDEQEEHEKLKNHLLGKFKLNPFIGSDGVFFPQQCMSYGCTKWAVKTSFDFMKHFSDLSGLPFRFENFLNRIKPEI